MNFSLFHFNQPKTPFFFHYQCLLVLFSPKFTHYCSNFPSPFSQQNCLFLPKVMLFLVLILNGRLELVIKTAVYLANELTVAASTPLGARPALETFPDLGRITFLKGSVLELFGVEGAGAARCVSAMAFFCGVLLNPEVICSISSTIDSGRPSVTI